MRACKHSKSYPKEVGSIVRHLGNILLKTIAVEDTEKLLSFLLDRHAFELDWPFADGVGGSRSLQRDQINCLRR